MSKFNHKSAQRGTLLVEAIAMLGLIALVTPNLYRKSAERLQEIQDINMASQARTMNSVIGVYMANNVDLLLDATSSVTTVEIGYDDVASASDGSGKGYSSFLPFGYSNGDLKNYDAPRVFVHRDAKSLTSFVVYPSKVDVGKKRASRIASLVGSNGGMATVVSNSDKNIFGTGGAWGVDSSALSDMPALSSMINDNALVITSSEPISQTDVDSDKFLYRIPPEEGGLEHSYHNTMVTDLYLGGHPDGARPIEAADYYSVYNVRKLTLNTKCNSDYLSHPHESSSAECNTNVADLYIGKPVGAFTSQSINTPGSGYNGNTGAAWIYGNLSALNDSFRLHRGSNGYVYAGESTNRTLERNLSHNDIMEFARLSVNEDGSSIVEVNVLRAENGEGDSSKVEMMDAFVTAGKVDGEYAFWVGNAETGGSSFIYAGNENGMHALRLNSPDQASSDVSNYTTYINRHGGVVYINGGSSGTAVKHTFINDNGGELDIGPVGGNSGSWLSASGESGSSQVHILSGSDVTSTDDRIFTVGAMGESDNHMIYGDSSKVSLRGGGVRVYSRNPSSTDAARLGGTDLINVVDSDFSVPDTGLTGTTGLLSKYTNIIGSTYMGGGEMDSSDISGDGALYTRDNWTLGIAGSAWVDKLLWARHAWFKDTGSKELHAGYDNFDQYYTERTRNTAWLNAYSTGVVIRNRDYVNGAGDSIAPSSADDTLFEASSSGVIMRDLQGAWAELKDATARIGSEGNYIFASDGKQTDVDGDSSHISMVGSSRVNLYSQAEGRDSQVDIQKGAMVFGGHYDDENSSSYVAAKTHEFAVTTEPKGIGNELKETAQFYIDNNELHTRFVDVAVINDESSAVFKVMPNTTADTLVADNANVQVHGSFHVNGNDIIHIGTNALTKPGVDGNDNEDRAMLEIEHDGVQVWAKTGEGGTYPQRGGDDGDPGYYALLKVNPYDVSGAASSVQNTGDASVYIRRGAIELEPNSGSEWAADEGFGYIKANRFVANDSQRVPSASGHGTAYDQYMVNPAYTSVMHDIKLTTRGGARLSDVLPDYVLKGVYNLINDCPEGTNTGSCGSGTGGEWADPYIGVLPFGACPPGYKNLATVVPISFNMGQAGTLIQRNGKYVVDQNQRQAAAWRAIDSDAHILEPQLEAVESVVFNQIYMQSDSFETALSSSQVRTEGWFYGYKAEYDDANRLNVTNGVSNGNPVIYTSGGSSYVVPTPLYFQQNTWLKTAVDPSANGGWRAYMGFIYDSGEWANSNVGQAGITTAPVCSNHNAGGGNADSCDNLAGYVWNLFPIPTGSLEGHATVYCYFDRSSFGAEWDGLIDKTNRLAIAETGGSLDKEAGASRGGSSAAFESRLNDPSLKYSDPW